MNHQYTHLPTRTTCGHPSATRIRIDGNARTASHGPFPEARHLVAGYWLWEVKDMDEAMAWALRCPNPMPEPSDIELRPLYGSEVASNDQGSAG